MNGKVSKCKECRQTKETTTLKRVFLYEFSGEELKVSCDFEPKLYF